MFLKRNYLLALVLLLFLLVNHGAHCRASQLARFMDAKVTVIILTNGAGLAVNIANFFIPGLIQEKKPSTSGAALD